MNYNIIALDLDGTLTNSQKIITDATKEALFKAQEKGAIVVLASGRPTCGIEPLAEELKLSQYGGYILSFNGGRIFDCKQQSVIEEQVVSPRHIPHIVQFAKQQKVRLLTYKDGVILTETPDCIYTQKEAAINNMPVQQVDDLAAFVDFEVPKCLLLEDGDYLAEVEQKAVAQFSTELDIFRSEPYFLEFMPKAVDKAASLAKLLAHLGLSREQLICCGDGFNDLSMISYAGLGVAMANAQPVVKQAADVITKSNDEDGLVPIIEQYLLS